MKVIQLTRGQFALVDDHWFDRLSRYTWQCSPDGYAYCYASNRYRIYMHRLIACTPNGLECDHINRNRLDNREHNLRNVTRAENLKNRGPRGAIRFRIPSDGTRRTPTPKPVKLKHLPMKPGRRRREGSIIKVRVSNSVLDTYLAKLQKQFNITDRGLLFGRVLDEMARLNIQV